MLIILLFKNYLENLNPMLINLQKFLVEKKIIFKFSFKRTFVLRLFAIIKIIKKV